jgi:hypothetical protein
MSSSQHLGTRVVGLPADPVLPADIPEDLAVRAGTRWAPGA